MTEPTVPWFNPETETLEQVPAVEFVCPNPACDQAPVLVAASAEVICGCCGAIDEDQPDLTGGHDA